MKKSQFVILLVVIVLCAGGIFGYVKYRLDKQEVDNNKTEEKQETNEKSETISNLNTLEGINNYLSNIKLTDAQSELMKKYNLSTKYVLNESETNTIIGLFINKSDNSELNPKYVPTSFSDGEFSSIDEAILNYSEYIKSNTISTYLNKFFGEAEYLDNRSYTLYEVNDTINGETYLAILCTSLANPSVSIYDKSLNEIGNFKYMGQMFGIINSETSQNVLNTNIHSNNNIVFKYDSVVTLSFTSNDQTSVEKISYSIENGVLKSNVVEHLDKNQFECANCK